MSPRDDFPAKVRHVLAKRVGWRCSICGAPTSGPGAADDAVVNVGLAGHITAAAPNGPRFDETLSVSERRSSSNGIWVCQTCGHRIDHDTALFTVEELRRRKTAAESRALTELGQPAPSIVLHRRRLLTAAPARFGSCSLRQLGVASAPNIVTGTPSDELPWVRRDVQSELERRVRDGLARRGVTVLTLTGKSSAGKTRLAAEVLREMCPDGWLVAPEIRIGERYDPALLWPQLYEEVAADATPVVIWLDDVELHVAYGPRVSRELLDALDDEADRSIIVVCTRGGKGQGILDRSLKLQLFDPIGAVCGWRGSEAIEVSTFWSSAEVDRLVEPKWTDQTRQRAGAVGLGPHLVGEPDLQRAYRSGELLPTVDVASADGQALVDALLAWRESGMLGPMPTAVLRSGWEVARQFRPVRGPADDHAWTRAVDWATSEVRFGLSAARYVPMSDGYEPDDALLGCAPASWPALAYSAQGKRELREAVGDDAQAALRLSVPAFDHDLDFAIECATSAVDLGSLDACAHCGAFLLHRRGPGDVDQAEDLLRRAHDAGHIYASYNLAVLLRERDNPSDQAEIPSLMAAAAAENTYVAAGLGVELLKRGGQEAAERAIELLRGAATAGESFAFAPLGVCLANQDDPALAHEGRVWLERAVESKEEINRNIALVRLAQFLLEDSEVHFDEAITLLNEAVEHDSPPAAFMLAGALLRRGGPEDLQAAMELYRSEPMHDSPDAWIALSTALRLEDRTAHRNEIVDLLRRAADRGRLHAWNILGEYFLGVEPSWVHELVNHGGDQHVIEFDFAGMDPADARAAEIAFRRRLGYPDSEEDRSEADAARLTLASLLCQRDTGYSESEVEGLLIEAAASGSSSTLWQVGCYLSERPGRELEAEWWLLNAAHLGEHSAWLSLGRLLMHLPGREADAEMCLQNASHVTDDVRALHLRGALLARDPGRAEAALSLLLAADQFDDPAYVACVVLLARSGDRQHIEASFALRHRFSMDLQLRLALHEPDPKRRATFWDELGRSVPAVLRALHRLFDEELAAIAEIADRIDQTGLLKTHVLELRSARERLAVMMGPLDRSMPEEQVVPTSDDRRLAEAAVAGSHDGQTLYEMACTRRVLSGLTEAQRRAFERPSDLDASTLVPVEHLVLQFARLRTRAEAVGMAEVTFRRLDAAGDGQASAELGRLLLEAGDPDGAEAAWRRADVRGHAAAARWLAELLSSQHGSQPDIDAAMERAVSRDDPTALRMRAQQLFATGETDACISQLDRAFDLGDVESGFHLGFIYFQQGALETAEKYYRRTVDHGAEAATVNLGAVLMRRGDDQGALDVLSRADAAGLEIGSHNLGILLLGRGDLEGGEAALRRAVARGSIYSRVDLAILLDRRGGTEEALALLAAAEEDGYAPAPFILGVILEMNGRRREARKAFARATESSDPEVRSSAVAALRALANPIGRFVPRMFRSRRPDRHRNSLPDRGQEQGWFLYGSNPFDLALRGDQGGPGASEPVSDVRVG